MDSPLIKCNSYNCSLGGQELASEVVCAPEPVIEINNVQGGALQ